MCISPEIAEKYCPSDLRCLDLDDLYILFCIDSVGGAPSSAIALSLRLTTPAISHRLIKYTALFGDDIFTTSDKMRHLTEVGKKKIKPCVDAFKAFLGVS